MEEHLAGVDRSGRGCNPRPAQNRNDPHTRKQRANDRKWESIKKIVVEGAFPDLEIVEEHLAGVDRSGRGCNPRPAPNDKVLALSGFCFVGDWGGFRSRFARGTVKGEVARRLNNRRNVFRRGATVYAMAQIENVTGGGTMLF